jgi:hypothetical protein
MANQEIADAAIAAMNDPNIESRPGFCSRFVRQVIAKVYGDKYRGLFGASAIDTGNSFKRSGLDASVTQQNQLEVGDILFKMRGSGGFGHVGIYVGARGIASNSSTSIGRVSGAKGFRTLGQWGQWDLVGRIPGSSPAQAQSPVMYQLMLNDVKIADMPVHNGQAWCPVRSWATALGVSVDWHQDNKRVVLNGHEIAETSLLIEERAYLPITVLVQQAGLRITQNNPATHVIQVTR